VLISRGDPTSPLQSLPRPDGHAAGQRTAPASVHAAYPRVWTAYTHYCGQTTSGWHWASRDTEVKFQNLD